jgi:DNA-binding NarL/FixJ family response regulator
MTTDSPQRIVLAEDAPLLNQMLSRILHRAQNVEIVQELHGLADMPIPPDGTQPDWVVISLSHNDSLPAWVDEYIARHPYVGIMVLSLDSARIRLRWSEIHERQLDDVSLHELMHILQNQPQAT